MWRGKRATEFSKRRCAPGAPKNCVLDESGRKRIHRKRSPSNFKSDFRSPCESSPSEVTRHFQSLFSVCSHCLLEDQAFEMNGFMQTEDLSCDIYFLWLLLPAKQREDFSSWAEKDFLDPVVLSADLFCAFVQSGVVHTAEFIGLARANQCAEFILKL